MKTENQYLSNYSATIVGSHIVEVFGWVYSILAVTATLIAAAFVAEDLADKLIYLVGGMLASLPGIMIVISAQMARAVVDNADHTRQILAIMRALSASAH